MFAVKMKVRMVYNYVENYCHAMRQYLLIVTSEIFSKTLQFSENISVVRFVKKFSVAKPLRLSVPENGPVPIFSFQVQNLEK